MKINQTIKAIGLGTDIESIQRFKKFNNKKSDFLNKIYTQQELDYSFSQSNPSQHLAARFTAKEAVIKALNNLGETIPHHKDIQILNDNQGIPSVKLNHKGLEHLHLTISLSHSVDTAIAFVIILT